MTSFALEAQGIRKAYGGVIALHEVSFAVRPGSVHALLGENGAGKSTLVKIMTGAVRPNAGSLRLNGEETQFRSTAHAVSKGVAVVAQELSLFPHLDILDNLFPMREPRLGPLIDRRRMRELALPVLEELGIDRPLTTRVAELSLAERQLVEISRALISQPKVLLLDEPTSALEAGASDRLLRVLRILREKQVGVVFVSHILEEVMSLCDEVTVLRDGRVVMANESITRLSMGDIVATMLGKTAKAPVARARPAPSLGAARLEVAGVSTRDGLSDVSFEARAGEILGLAGLAGSGPAAMLSAVAGISELTAGRITLPGGHARPGSFRAAIEKGVAFVSGDRRKLGLMLDKPIWENIVQVRSIGLSRDGGLLRTGQLRERAAALAARVGVKAPSVDLHSGGLSGGNQQKVVLAKWMDCSPTTLLLDDPTRGVDIGAREEINQLLRKASGEGTVILYLSTDLEELASGCDRVLVFYRGRICGELSGEALTAHALSQMMNTGKPVPSLETV